MTDTVNDTYPKFFDFNGCPARQDSEARLPFVLWTGGWQPYYDDPQKFATEAMEIDESDFDDLVEESGGDPDADQGGDDSGQSLAPEQVRHLGRQVAEHLSKIWQQHVGKEEGGAEMSLEMPEDDAQALAEHYAELWNLLEEVGRGVPEIELQRVDEELGETDWLLNLNADGKWEAKRAPEGGVEFAVAHSPKGGVTILNKFYRGGQFIPAAVVAQASPEVKAKLLETHKTHAEKRRQRGNMDAAGLRGRLQPHADVTGLTAADKVSAGRQWRGIMFHHGPMALHRIEELVALVEESLKGAPHSWATSVLTKKLAAYHHMMDLAAGHGITGEVPEEMELPRGLETPAAVVNEPPTPDNPTDAAAGNWRYADRNFANVGKKEKFRNNIAAIQTLREINSEGRTSAMPAEQEILSKYVGWGQFPEVFGYSYNEDWGKEKKILKDILSTEDYEAARKSTINAHYTAPDVVDAHWKIAKRLGFKGGRFLEPSAGVGYYMGMMPDDLAGKTRSTAVEIDPTTGKICELLYPGAKTHVKGFEEYQAPDGFYDLVASNVPFSSFVPFEKRYAKHKAALHDFFFLKSADLVKPGGLMMHITSAGTMDKGSEKIREELSKTCDFVGAIRFPGSAHKKNAGTEVVTDMVILRKRLPGEQPVSMDITPQEAIPARTPPPNATEEELEKWGLAPDSRNHFTGITTDSLGRLYHWVDGKRVPGPNWLETTTVPDPAGGDPIEVNSYFAQHPDMMLGTLDRTGTMYGADQKNVTKTDDYDQRLEAAINSLPQNVFKPSNAPAERFAPDVQPAPGDLKNGGYKVEGKKLLRREGGAIVEQEVSPEDLERIKGQLEIRDAVRESFRAQLKSENADAAREALNKVYDAYVAQHGFLNLKANRQAFYQDPDAPVLLALENWNEKTKEATKSDIFRRDTIRAVAEVTHADDVNGGVAVSLHETGGIDVGRIAKLTGKPAAEIEEELVRSGIAFQDPSEGWKPADQYLSGNVRKKLAMAKAAAEVDPKFGKNVEALLAVQPEDFDVSRIDVKLGAHWVPPADMADFAGTLLGGRGKDFEISYNKITGEWHADYSNSGWRLESSPEGKQWSTDKVGAKDIIKAGLNGKLITVKDVDSEGKEFVDKKETDNANAKVQELKDKFKEWIWEDDDRATRLHRYYNDNFNNVRRMKYNGQHQQLPGLTLGFQPHPHIKDFVWQVVTTGKGLANHEVGAGKTAAMIISAMELRRLGLAKKPAIACLKANIEQITAEARKLYPGAKILTTAGMFSAKDRKKTVSQIATGDYDMVILTHDHLGLMKMTPETQRKYIREEIADLEAAKLEAVKADPSKGNKVVKQLEKAKLALEAKLKKALDESKKDDAVFFEETGIDQMFVDEAHNFQGLPVYTKTQRLKGIPNSRSDKATSMLMRTRWLMEQNGNRGVVFATGTPVTNTMAELYNVQRYLQPDELKEHNINNFDQWANMFGEIKTRNEYNVAGEYKPTSRFSEFVNLSALAQMTGKIMDTQRIEDLRKPAPKLDDIPSEARAAEKFSGITRDAGGNEYHWKEGVPIGKPIVSRPHRKDKMVIAPPSKDLASLMKNLQERAHEMAHRAGPPEKGGDNMLAICTDGRKGALDMRLVDPAAKDNPESKTNLAIKNVLRIQKERPGVTQIIFSDVGVNPVQKGKHAKVALEEDDVEMSEEDAAAEALKVSTTGFHLYNDIIGKLVKGGIPREQIADFTNLEGKKKEEAMAKMRKGEILVAIGSTQKLGTGVNVQDKLAAMHHLDVPWKPAQVEQRDGRGWRHGNENKDVEIHRYIGEGSLDAFFWQIIGNKQKFINQVTRGDENVDRAKDEDSEELTPEQFHAAATGDMRVVEKVDLESEVRQLRSASERHKRDQTKLKNTIKETEQELPRIEAQTEKHRQDAQHVEATPDFSFEIEEISAPEGKMATRKKVKHDKRPEAAASLAKAIEAYQRSIESTPEWQRPTQTFIGEYKGMGVYFGKGQLRLQGPSGHIYDDGSSLQSLENVARKIKGQVEYGEQKTAERKASIEKLKGAIGKPFAKEGDLATKTARLKQIEEELRGEHKLKESLPEAKSHATQISGESVDDDALRIVDAHAQKGKVAAEREFKRIVNERDLPSWQVDALRKKVLAMIGTVA